MPDYTGQSDSEIRRLHLPQFDEIYLKVKNRVGKLILKYKRAERKDPRRSALEILDTAFQIVNSKLLAYRQFSKLVLGNQELRTYISTVLGDEALSTLKRSAHLHNRVRNLWLTLRRELEYAPERGREINHSLKQVSRLLSYVRRRKGVLEKSLEIKKELSLLPGLSGQPRVVIVGPPNAGKSSIANRIGKTETKIADYPFTTKAIEPGVSEKILNGIDVAVLDTPGLLDRENERRNIIERRAIAAVKLPNTVIIYVIDPFSTIMSLESQLSLYTHILNLNPNVVVVVNKIDVDREASLRVKEELEGRGVKPVLLSALTGEGVDSLLNVLADVVGRLVRKNGAA